MVAPSDISAAITSVQAAFNIAKAMVGLRDAEVFRAKAFDLQAAMLDAIEKAIAAREAQSNQLDRIRALETEVASFKTWDTEKKRYELVMLSRGGAAYMLKPEARGTEPPHWLCPNCFSNSKKGFFQPSPTASPFGSTYECGVCHGQVVVSIQRVPRWEEKG